jgi:hypothetical protein
MLHIFKVRRFRNLVEGISGCFELNQYAPKNLADQGHSFSLTGVFMQARIH